MLGQAPADPDEGDERVANMMKILERGFPDGTLAAVCWDCNQVQELGLDETAVMIVDGAWPRCHNKRMDMVASDDIPQF